MSHNLQTTWKAVLSEMKKDVSAGTFTTLFKSTELLSLNEGVATIATPSTIISDLLKKRFGQTIKQHIEVIVQEEVTPFFIVQQVQQELSSKQKPTPLFESNDAPEKIVQAHLPRVRPEYTFDNFAVSSSNELAYVSAKTVAEHLGVSYNPFFMYGPVGVGKTHLMQAIANFVYQLTPEKKTIYITSEEFTNEVVEAIQQQTTTRMKQRFRTAYLLIIDDVQFFEGKEKVQEELFHTFNYLIDNGSQIVLSSDRPPQEIKKLQSRLSSRFAGGLTVDIEQPDFELKTAILLIKAKKFGYSLPMDVAQQLAETAQDTRTLEGNLLRVITQATTQNTEITSSFVASVLKTGGNRIQGERIHPDDIIKQVCQFYNVKPTLLRSAKRDASIVRARQVTMYLLKTELHLTLVEIGNTLGGRDHTTVMHGVEKIEMLVENKEQVNDDIVGIKRLLMG